jgi:hypothetical protein
MRVRHLIQYGDDPPAGGGKRDRRLQIEHGKRLAQQAHPLVYGALRQKTGQGVGRQNLGVHAG